MNLFKIQHELISDSTADAWYQTKIAGPYFHYRWTWGTGPEDGFSYVSGEHRGHAVHRNEPSLTMSWGMDVHRDRDDLVFPWAAQFPNPKVTPFWVDFFWNNALIDRVELAHIDGSHGTIPMPGYGLEVTDYETAVAHLVHDLSGGQNHDNPSRYLKMLGFKQVSDDAREGAGSN